LVVIVVPLFFLIGSLISEFKELKLQFQEGSLTIPLPNEKVKEWPLIGENLYEFWQSLSENLEGTILKYKDQLTGFGKTVAKGIFSSVSGVFQIMAALIIAGILLAIGGTGDSVRKFFRKLAGDKGDDFADIALSTVGSVVKGVMGVALILAMLNGILFILAGIPYSGIWTLIIFVLCVLQIPVFIVTIPIIIYMFATKELVPAILWTALMLLVGTSDNILKPILLGKGAPVPMLVIFIGVIGGFILSGFIGLFTGAIVMSIGYKLFMGWLNTDKDSVLTTKDI
jgi:predicted PurR-regulated permease PerM